MTEPRLADDPRQHAAVRNYTLLCVAALLVMVVTLLAADVGPLSLLPVMAGSLALVTYWRSGPALVLGCLTVLLLIRWSGRDPAMVIASLLRGRFAGGSGRTGAPGPEATLLYIALTGAMLAYTAGFFRLHTIVREAFPRDRRKGKKLPPQLVRRDPELVTGREMSNFLLSVPLWTVLGGLVLWWAMHPPTLGLPLASPDRDRRLLNPSPLTPLGMPPELWQLIALVLVGGFGLALVAYLIGYVGLRRARREEAELYLQDQLWQQTRHEQMRINRWVVWRRLRGQRREEKS